jgi:dTDP-4-amino-4,6-dideoxygalactose transaminase
MGLTGLESIEEFIAVNQRNYKQYQQELAGTPGVKLIDYNEIERRNCQYIVLKIDETITQIDRDHLVSVLNAENVIARRYFYPGCHRMEPYCSDSSYTRQPLPETEKLIERILTLPTGISIGPDEIAGICQIIRFGIEHGIEVKSNIGQMKGPLNP